VWFMGYTPNLSTAAMIAGANRKGEWVTLNGQTVGGEYITSAYGSTVAGPMWGDAMQRIDDFLPDEEFQSPDPTAVQGQTITVPSVYGMNPSQAATELRKAGLFPTIGPMVDSSYGYGTVAYTSPGAGTQTSSGGSITIYVSDGTPAEPPSDGGGDDDGGGRGNGGGPGPDDGGNGNGNGNGNGRGPGGDGD